MDRLDELRLFVAIVEGGSLAAAGRRLGHAPPVVTRALAAMEDRLGTRLVERSTRRSRPTDPGQRLAAQARLILAEYDAALAEAAGETGILRGRLRVAAPLVFGTWHVAPIVAAFLDAHPALGVDLQLADRNSDLFEEAIDVAIRIGPPGDASLVARRVGTLRRVLAASPDYLARCGIPSHPAALAAHETILFAARGATAEWQFRTPDGDALSVRVAPRYAVDAAEAAVAAAIAGRGIVSALSYQPAPAFHDGRLVRLLRAFEPPPVPVSLVFASSRLLPARARAFIDFAAPRLAALAELRGD